MHANYVLLSDKNEYEVSTALFMLGFNGIHGINPSYCLCSFHGERLECMEARLEYKIVHSCIHGIYIYNNGFNFPFFFWANLTMFLS